MRRWIEMPMPSGLKTLILIAAVLLFLPGLMALLFVPVWLLNAFTSTGQDAIGLGVFTLVYSAFTLGAGGVTIWHCIRSLSGKPSSWLRLPPAWLLAGIFALLIIAGLFVREARAFPGILFDPLLLVAAALPTLAAVAWWTSHSGTVTRRRGMVAFAGGMTFSVAVALLLEIVFPVFIIFLVLNAGDLIRREIELLLSALAGMRIAQALTSPGFIIALVEGAVLAPLAEEFAKPLVTLPLIGRLGRREAFLVAAMAGAGFAALENVIYASAGIGSTLWAGILVLRSLGAAVHPLGAGLTGLSIRDILNGEPHAWRNGLARFGLAVGMHSIWNGGSILVFTLAGAQFFGRVTVLNFMGLSATGVLVALLLILGLAALWIGSRVAESTRLPFEPKPMPAELSFALSDRAIAIWALACLIAIVPVGIAALRLLLR